MAGPQRSVLLNERKIAWSSHRSILRTVQIGHFAVVQGVQDPSDVPFLQLRQSVPDVLYTPVVIQRSPAAFSDQHGFAGFFPHVCVVVEKLDVGLLGLAIILLGYEVRVDQEDVADGFDALQSFFSAPWRPIPCRP